MNPLHTNDQKMFEEHPAPLWEAWMKLHPSLINHTTPHFGPMMYWIVRAIGGVNALEIGIAQGYSSFFIASAIKDNNKRYGANGKYYACDILDKGYIFDPLIEKGFPIKFIMKNSVTLTREDIDNQVLDFVFLDGWHHTEHVMKELEIIYPLLKDNGNGYLLMHDVYAWCTEAYKLVMEKYNFESVRFINNYGLAIMRKMDNYDDTVDLWPQGDQKAEDGFVY